MKTTGHSTAAENEVKVACTRSDSSAFAKDTPTGDREVRKGSSLKLFKILAIENPIDCG